MPHFTANDGLSLHFTDEGTGLPVLCLSGLTRNGRDFDYVAPYLDDVRLIRMDYRGRGQSDFGDWHSYTVAQEARDAVTLLDHLGLARAAVLGTSRGGLIAMLLAATARDRMIGAALNDVGPELELGGLDRIMDYLGKPPPFASRAEMAAAQPHLAAGFRDVPASRWAEHVERMTGINDDGTLALTYDPHLRDAVLEGAGTPAPDLWPLFDAMAGLPVALIRGANSDLLSAAAAEKMRARMPGLLFAEVPDRAHTPFLDEPEAVAVLRDWIDQCQSR